MFFAGLVVNQYTLLDCFGGERFVDVFGSLHRQLCRHFQRVIGAAAVAA